MILVLNFPKRLVVEGATYGYFWGPGPLYHLVSHSWLSTVIISTSAARAEWKRYNSSLCLDNRTLLLVLWRKDAGVVLILGVIRALWDSPTLSWPTGFSPSLPHLLIYVIPHFWCGTGFSSLFGCARWDKFGIIDTRSRKSCVIVKWLDVWVPCFTPFQILYAISFIQYDFIIILCNTLGIIYGIALGPLFLWTQSTALSCSHLES